MTTNNLEYELTITKTTRQAAGAGTWVIGQIDGYRFEALVFPEHAEQPEWELGHSGISKLWVRRLSDRAEVFNWDRGADVPAASDEVQAVVDFLAEGIAELVYHR